MVADSGTGGALHLRRPRSPDESLVALEAPLAYSAGNDVMLTFDPPARGRSGGFRMDGNRVTNIRFDRVP